MNIIKPELLKEGDTVAIIATSGNIEPESKEIFRAVNFFEKQGLKTVVSNDIYKQKRYLAGDDETKIQNIHNAFLNDKINAIVCLRGGYGAIRLINELDYSIIRNNPKIFCGFSDVTALNLMFYKKAGLISYSGPMIMSDFGNDYYSEFTMTNFINAVKHNKFNIEGTKSLKKGTAKGILWGGNLSTVVSLCGQDFIPDEPFIFFTEDINEPVYKIDKMLNQLINIEKFRKNIKGLCFGDFIQTDNTNWLSEVLKEVSCTLKVPTTIGFQISHAANKLTLPIGVNAELKNNMIYIE